MDMKEETEPVRIDKKRPHCKWKDSHVVLFVLLVVLTILFPGGGIFYLCARFRPYPLALGGVLMLYLAVIVFMVYCFIAGIGQLVSGWMRHNQKKKILIAVQIAIPVMFVLLFILQFSGPHRLQLWPDSSPFTYGLRDRIRSKVDIPAIRTWLRTLDEKAFSDFEERLNSEDWPKSLRIFKGEHITLASDRNGKPRIRVSMGAGFSHWAVIIGFEDMEIPSFVVDESYGSWLQVEPGVYVYDY